MKRVLVVVFILMPALLLAQVKGVKHVILIGLDGAGANYLAKAENIPHMKRMMQDGSYTLHARCVRPSSSAVNWAAMTMGANPSLTGYTEWDSKKPEIPSRAVGKYGIFPTIFEILHEQKPQSQIGVIYTWSGIGYLFPHQVVNKNDHTDDDSLTAANAVQYITSHKPNLLFLHFDGIDHAGHTIGWGTPAYYQAISKIDSYIGQILQAVKEAGIMKSTIILVTADHGGKGKSHGGKSIEEMEIPWIIYGKEVKKGKELKESIMTFDTAATIAYIFGLKTPQVWIGRPVKVAFK